MDDISLLELIGKFHPAFVHFPIVLIFLTFICDIIVLSGKRHYEEFGDFSLFLTILFFIPTFITGYIAGAELPAKHVFWHKWIAILTILFAVVFGVWRLYLSKKHLDDKMRYNIIGSVILFILIFITGDLGGTLTHGVSPLLNFFKH